MGERSYPTGDRLYRRVHRKLINSAGGIRAGAFTDYQGGMSTDWDKHSTPQETRYREVGLSPDEFAVVSLPVAEMRDLGQIVEHDPLPENRAHTNVVGDKRTEVRLNLARMCQVVIAIKPD